jgi:acyl-CoA thioesterase YciA
MGKTSMTIRVEVWAMPEDQHEHYLVTEGIFVSVAIDEQGKPRPVSKKE